MGIILLTNKLNFKSPFKQISADLTIKFNLRKLNNHASDIGSNYEQKPKKKGRPKKGFLKFFIWEFFSLNYNLINTF